jgi:hypothetical protein
MTNDILVYGGCVIGAMACLLAFSLYHVYSGTHGSLSTAKVGDVFNFEYLQPAKGDPERFLVKVLGVTMLDDNQIRRLNAKSNYRRNDSNFQRTRHLITGRSADGTVRNFYAERVVNCRRPLLGGTIFKAGLAHLFC